MKPEYLGALQKRAKDLGIWMMEVPEEYGGAGLSLFQRALVRRGAVAHHRAAGARRRHHRPDRARHILFALEGELKENYLMPVLRGEKKVCFAQTEPDAGSDPGGMRTTAVRDGDHYVINGVKRFITGADKADFMQLMAATDRAKGSRGGISCFLVDMDTPGVKLGTSLPDHDGRPALGDHLRQRARAGDQPRRRGRRGLRRSAQKWLGAGRIKHGARALGVAERCLEMATVLRQAALDLRPAARRPAGDPVDARRHVHRAAGGAAAGLQGRVRASTRGEDAREDAYVCKYYADEMAFRAADECMQIHGGIALTTDLPIEKFWRQQRSYRITEGASEVMKMVIARHVLKTYA